MKNIYFIQPNNVYGNERRSVYLPYASGCIAAYAFADEKIGAECRFGGFVYTHEAIDDAVGRLCDPFVAAFSCSVWNYEYNKALATALKKEYPKVKIIFGGHNVLRDFETLEECSAVDFLIYREGEEAFRQLVLALLDGGDFSQIANIAYRTEKSFAKTREEGFGLYEYPSPYLNGFFDCIIDGETSFSAILETNRGCPFHCSFCDWGTLGSKVRLFPMERIKAEIDWIAKNKIEYVYCADGNFGLFDRDEEIAEYIISAKQTTGYPHNFRVCFTKNRTQFVKKICLRFNENGLDKAQTLSFQSLCGKTLENIGRKNISLDHFRELMNEYSRCSISTSSELILGLPGETRESFTKGLCELIEYGQHKAIQVYPCELLPNSQMGDKDYIAKHSIETVKTPFAQAHCNARDMHEITEYTHNVIKTATLSSDDWVYCVAFSCLVQAFHNIGFFRAAALYLRNESKISYYDIYSALACFSQDEENTACNAVWSLVNGFASGVVRGENSWVVPCEGLGEISWQFDEIYFLKSLENAEKIYEELSHFTVSLAGDTPEVRALMQYQRDILKRINTGGERIIVSDYDFYSYCKRIYNGEYQPLEKKKTVICVNDTEICRNLYEYAVRCIWYGRNHGLALYVSDYYKPQITE